MNAMPLVALEAAVSQAGRPVTYAEHLPASRSLARPPAFIFGGLPDWLAADLFGEFVQASVGCYRLEGARVSTDGVILQDGEAFWCLGLNHPEHLVRRLVEPGGVNRGALPVRRIPGLVATIHGPGYDVFGHWLVDILPRLYLLDRAGFDVGRLRLLLPADTPRFGREFLRLAGIPDANIVWHDHAAELAAPDTLLAPTILRLKNRLSPCFAEATAFWADRLGAGAAMPPTGPGERRIYVSRAQATGRRLLQNREEVEAMAVAAGYELVHPERLSLQDQVQLFRSASHIVGEYGSGLHSTVFAQAGAKVCALRGASHNPGFVQSALAETAGHDIGYVLAPTTRHARQPEMRIDPDLFARALEAMELPRAQPDAPAGPAPPASPIQAVTDQPQQRGPEQDAPGPSGWRGLVARLARLR